MIDEAFLAGSIVFVGLTVYALTGGADFGGGVWDLLARVIPEGRRPRMLGDKMHKLAAVFRQSDENAIYRRLVSQWPEPGTFISQGEESIGESWRTAEELRDFTERMAYLDTVTYLPDDILTKVDRASMAHSLEVRVPLLDHKFVEWVSGLPPGLKLRGQEGKYIFKKSLEPHLPEDVLYRQKMGFGVPLDSWLRGPLRDWAESLLNETKIESEGYLRAPPVRKLWADHLSGKKNLGQPLLNILAFQD